MNTTSWPEGIKKTKQREAIWSVLTTTDKPITAMEIAERFRVVFGSVFARTSFSAMQARAWQDCRALETGFRAGLRFSPFTPPVKSGISSTEEDSP